MALAKIVPWSTSLKCIYIIFIVPCQCESAINKYGASFADFFFFFKLFSSNKNWDEKAQKDLTNAEALDMLNYCTDIADCEWINSARCLRLAAIAVLWESGWEDR